MSFFLQNSCRARLLGSSDDFAQNFDFCNVDIAASVCAMYLFFASLRLMRLMCLEGISTLTVWLVES